MAQGRVRSGGRDRSPWQDSRQYRERALELAPRIRAQRRRVFAVHEAGHFLVAAYLGELLESIGLEVGGRVQMAIVVTPGPRGWKLSRAERAAVLAAGGLAQARLGVPAHSGSGSDEQQIEELRLSPATVEKARLRASKIVELAWPDVELLADVFADHHVISGETALAYVLAQHLEPDRLLGDASPAAMLRAYRSVVDARI